MLRPVGQSLQGIWATVHPCGDGHVGNLCRLAGSRGTWPILAGSRGTWPILAGSRGTWPSLTFGVHSAFCRAWRLCVCARRDVFEWPLGWSAIASCGGVVSCCGCGLGSRGAADEWWGSPTRAHLLAANTARQPLTTVGSTVELGGPPTLLTRLVQSWHGGSGVWRTRARRLAPCPFRLVHPPVLRRLEHTLRWFYAGSRG